MDLSPPLGSDRGTLAESLVVPSMSVRRGQHHDYHLKNSSLNSPSSYQHQDPNSSSSHRSRYDSHQSHLRNSSNGTNSHQQHNVHFHGQAHTANLEDLLPSPSQSERRFQTFSGTAGHHSSNVNSSGHAPLPSSVSNMSSATALASVQCSVHAMPLKEDLLRTHSPIASTIFIILLMTTFLINLHLAIQVSYKHDNFSKKVVGLSTHKEFLILQLLTVLGLIGVFLANPAILWTFSAATFALFLTLIAISDSDTKSVATLANLVALASLGAHLGSAYRVPNYVPSQGLAVGQV